MTIPNESRILLDTNQMQRASIKRKLSRSNETFSNYEEIWLQFYPIDDRNSFESLSEILGPVVVGNLLQLAKTKAQNTLIDPISISYDQKS